MDGLSDLLGFVHGGDFLRRIAQRIQDLSGVPANRSGDAAGDVGGIHRGEMHRAVGEDRLGSVGIFMEIGVVVDLCLKVIGHVLKVAQNLVGHVVLVEQLIPVGDGLLVEDLVKNFGQLGAVGVVCGVGGVLGILRQLRMSDQLAQLREP